MNANIIWAKRIAIFTTIFCSLLQVLSQNPTKVKIWEEELVLPTYVVDPPEKSPMFFKNDSYQGASRVIYPYALEDDITNKKITKSYRAVYIENEYLKVCVLPEIGGRLFYATDKTNGYEIFYRQHVIKPAHVGMLGAWISGGIEFCVFHHHRASTNMPIDFHLAENEDGSATLWIGETEWRHRMKWTFGISLYPGKSYLEVDGRMINPTENTNSILYWANVATHVNDDYQVIFPSSTQFATFHSKNSFSHWPITQEAYRGNEYYANNIDASWWKNHPGHNSFFAHDIKEGFLAGYDYGKQAGTMVVGNPHIVKGAKLWEWGKGSVWDTKVLTDNDGPYAELMSGAYSDNQPDYSWIKPYEFKNFKQFWFPMRESEGAKAANLNGLLNINMLSEEEVYIAANTTASFKDASIVLREGEKILFEKRIDISPAKPFHEQIKLQAHLDKNKLTLQLLDSANELLLSYVPAQLDPETPLPEEVIPPLAPAEIESIEELYLTGLRIKQFHNARISPLDYFEEALKRDPLDTRSNTQMGIIYKERGEFTKAASYFRKALFRLSRNYTRPRNCEAFYHLGIILKDQGKMEHAYDTLYRAAWDHSFSSPAYFQLAEISSQQGNYEQALLELERSLLNNSSNLNALNLRSVLLRKLGRDADAKNTQERVLKMDPLNFWAYHEHALLSGDRKDADQLTRMMRDHPESYLELASAYLSAGFIKESKGLLIKASISSNKTLSGYPSIHYYLGYLEHLDRHPHTAKQHFINARKQSTDYCFPFRLESQKVYQVALEYEASDAKAYYYLGNLLYDKQPEKAIQFWEKAVEYDPALSIAHRNLGWAYFQTHKDLDGAIQAYELAIKNDKQQPRYYDELDRLYEQNGEEIEKRYALLSQNHEVVREHNRPLIREAMVSIAAEDYDHAIEILTTNYFNRREGRSNIHDIYVDALLLKGKSNLRKRNWKQAIKDFEAADLYPENQSIGRDETSERRAQIFYYTALALEKMGKKKEARKWYEKAISFQVKSSEYNYQKALAYQKLGQDDDAHDLFKLMEAKGKSMLERSAEVDFFSKFGGNQWENKRKADANYLLGLAELGEGKKEQAQRFFEKAKELHPGHAWARQMLKDAQ